MLFQTVIYFTFTILCVSSMCDRNCLRQYTRVKRGKYFSYPAKFYNLPPFPIAVKGPFSHTPPPFMVDYEPHYIGSRPYKVSKRPTSPVSDGLGDDDITNLVKHLSKQDLDKILEFAQERDQAYNKYNDIYNTNEYNRPYKRESKILTKGNVRTKYEEPLLSLTHPANYVTEPTFANIVSAQDTSKPVWIVSDTSVIEKNPYQLENYAFSEKAPNDNFRENYVNSQIPINFFGSHNQVSKPTYINDFTAQDSPRPLLQSDTQNTVPSLSHNSQGPISFPAPNNPYYTESDEEDKLPHPDNMKLEDFEISYTNNIPKVVTADTYDIKNFGDLPLMDYSDSKLKDVSSYHVPHYTITQPKPSKPAASLPISYSAPSYSSSSLLKPSPAAAAIEEPVYEPAPPVSAAAEQSDAHLKAIKIWAHKSKGAAYTLHDDGTLTPERNKPKYG